MAMTDGFSAAGDQLYFTSDTDVPGLTLNGTLMLSCLFTYPVIGVELSATRNPDAESPVTTKSV